MLGERPDLGLRPHPEDRIGCEQKREHGAREELAHAFDLVVRQWQAAVSGLAARKAGDELAPGGQHRPRADREIRDDQLGIRPQQAVQKAVLSQPAEREHEALDQALLERVVRRDCRIYVAEEAAHLSLQDGIDELVLAREVLVDRDARDADALRDIADREPADAELLGLLTAASRIRSLVACAMGLQANRSC